MVKDDNLWLGDMLDYALRAVNKVHGVDRQAFEEDENLRLALVHLIMIIGEAASHISGETRNKYQQIPWKNIVGMRHKIVHDYVSVNDSAVWEIATIDLPPLISELRKILPPEEGK